MKAKKELRILGLKRTNAIQKTTIVGKDCYVLQTVKKTYTILSRCRIVDKFAIFEDEMILGYFGHGQTLDSYEWNGKVYFLLNQSCEMKPVEEFSGIAWGREIGRIEYVAGRTIPCDLNERLGELTYNSILGEYYGLMKRVDAAISSDKKELFLCVENGKGEIQLSVLNFHQLNELWDKKPKAMQTLESISKDVDVTQIVQWKKQEKQFPNGSNQGVAYNGGAFFLGGGNMGTKDFPRIIKVSGEKFNERLEVDITNEGFDTFDCEIEGCQIIGDRLFFGVSRKEVNRQEVYSIELEAFHG